MELVADDMSQLLDWLIFF